MRHFLKVLGAIALSAVLGCQNNEPATRQPKPTTGAAKAESALQDNRGQVALDASALSSRLAVIKTGKGDDSRQVVVLGRPNGMQDDSGLLSSQPGPGRMLPREDGPGKRCR